MTEQSIILNRLLDKYGNSKHLSDPGASHRRVMLRVEKNELPEYSYEGAAAERVHPQMRAGYITDLARSSLEGIAVPWIVA